ncbi:type II CAAX endopeptidase family protein [Melissococcus plutonius]|uniref:Abortive infection protein n=1 Tax=Melissococcus plutonius TaxID=33970 RepID=A0A2Z5Y1D4_9ENTE|nr:type II CAAX endopeptidase family protein [Melissococcus plutonius]MCV2498319.1 CPBP family intramembrane metalloprotease [Melissococcus plutonius]MCV2500816.1 CPBP family intramembrane metalloprotease [Melissococcus plutonius]MCV2504570.1 CPBP family intramembrane metalloprotease [Melissococcus plutonius]MCV2506934.1 CPBP family intramembrane metalloprotease [Melissococcus plutonius]MCV2519576.1 CPBP family intramembrane metalloprotease [Melissococcus plutonius]
MYQWIHKKLNNFTVSIWMIFIYLFVLFSPLLLVIFPTSIRITFFTFIYFLGALLLIFLYNKKDQPTELEKNATMRSSVFVFLLGIGGIFIALIIQSIVTLLEYMITKTTPDTSQNTQNIIRLILNSPIFIIATVICGPIMEEFVFRRSLVTLIKPKLGFWLAAIISSAIFSLAHNDQHFFVYFAIGLFFSYIYKLTGRIWTSILAHCGMNTLVVIIQLISYFYKIN